MLALWEYFWTEADWVQAPPVVVPDAVPSGGARGDGYRPLPDEFWEARDRYIRRHITPAVERTNAKLPPHLRLVHPSPAPETVDTETEAAVARLVTERSAALSLARAATSATELRTASARALQLTLDISNLIDDYYMQAAIILLLDVS